MKPETAQFLDKAHECLADATRYQLLVPRIAGREAYLAAFHAAEALFFERTGKIAKTHRGLRAQFARIAKTRLALMKTWRNALPGLTNSSR